MWQKIIELGKAENKRKKTLHVYAHNMQYDFYAIANITDPKITYNSLKPFIATYKINNREAIKFLDTMAIYKMPLKSIGKIINIKKTKTPKTLLQEKKTTQNQKEITKYMIKDTIICLEAILRLKKKLKKEGIKIKRLYTINQIAIQYLIKKLQETTPNNHIFSNKKIGITHKTFREKEIHEAYRGGRVQAFKTGKHKNIEYIDCNSLYPYITTTIKFPDLRTERKIQKPLTKITKKELLSKIGISRILIKNENNKIGIIPVRTKGANYYPTKGQHIIGTYTHEEIKECIKEGYKLIKVEWSIIYQEGNNPFKEITPKLYKLRQESENELDNYFYKMMMNASYGKLGQYKTTQKIIIDNVEKQEEYLKKNYKLIKGIKLNYLYQKTIKNKKKKNYYTPIIPTIINAKARIYMYKQLKKIPEKELLYTDTDSIIYIKKPNKIIINKELGNFKIETTNKNITIYGKKAYTIHNEKTTIAGTNTKHTTKENIKKGIITVKTMNTIKNQTKREIGTFNTTTRNLNNTLKEHEITRKKYESQKILIDSNIENIDYFKKEIKEILNI